MKKKSAFQILKKSLVFAPVLSYPNFDQPYQIDTDTCEFGVVAFLSQDSHPLAYYSKKLSSVRQKASTYARELWAVTDVVQRWRYYLLGHQFEIRTDYQSLKNLLSQSIQMPDQKFFLSKLLGFNFTITYKPGKKNLAVDALSRVSANVEPMGVTFNSMVSILKINSWTVYWLTCYRIHSMRVLKRNRK